MTKTTMNRRAILAGLPATAATSFSDVLPGGAATPGDDPIFAVLAEHKAAQAARDVVNETYPDDAPEQGEARGRETEAHLALFTVVPTTAAGAAAWLHRIGSPEFGGEDGCMVTVEFSEEFQNVIARQMRAVAAMLAQVRS